ncbi:50S ribosomal protein L25 [Prosthecomicrobium hirschii]|jgi:large subunit ribosomal protein L25|uniref:Large ribosomal subunit protein bL25 n=1 Tax=Prosthecodimorpha hirschii TaxID=665126 RepID=A0A0P6WHW0_9HYPH|nr:50S ribosomal protein L25/general stress protein Ctc [Prosthecomicrobium hirschii]KPL54351.1 50S ribosomal protein L25 [Prosthecomicrobium hirschii]TPQ46182.1 50S ribosomal protein L25 [Prosthecomicrobium hirschii]
MSRQSYELQASVRDRVGKGAARLLRRTGNIPAVIYGDKKPPIAIAIDYREADKRLRAGGFMTTVATIAVGGEKILVIPKDYHLDPVKDSLTHIDFLRIGAGSKVTVWVPVHIVGQDKSPGIKRGGAINVVRHEIEFECQADQIPEHVVADVSALEINDSLHISGVQLPEGVKPVIQDRDFTVVTIAAPAGFDEPATASA